MSFAENLDGFFVDFGVEATIGGKTVRGIFDNGSRDLLSVATRAAAFRCVEADVPDALGQSCIIGGVTYKVVTPEPDGTGLTTLRLEKQ